MITRCRAATLNATKGHTKKAADAADGATGGKFSDKIDSGSDAVKSGIDKMSGS